MCEYGDSTTGVRKRSIVQELAKRLETRLEQREDSVENTRYAPKLVFLQPQHYGLPSARSGFQNRSHPSDSTPMKVRETLVRKSYCSTATNKRPPIAPKPPGLSNVVRGGFAKNEVPSENVRLQASPRLYGGKLTKRWSTPNFASENDETLNRLKEYSKCNGNDECSENERLNNLFYAAKEIYEEEDEFMKKLEKLTVGFSNFLNDPREWQNDNTRRIAEKSAQIVRQIRVEIVKIWIAHNDLLIDLRYSMKKWNAHEPDMGSYVGMHSKQLFSACFDFLNNRERLLKEFQGALETDIVFKERTRKFEESHLNGLSYISELDSIHQNIVRYELLLKKYAKYLQPDSMEAAKVNQITLAIREDLKELNRKLELSAMHLRQCEISQRFKDDFDVLKSGRTLRYEGDVQKVSGSRLRLRYFILFSDVLLIARASSDSKAAIRDYVCLPLERVHAEAEQHIEHERRFILQKNDGSKITTTTYLAGSKMKRNVWVEKINDAALKTTRDGFGFYSGQSDSISLDSSYSGDASSLPSCIPDSKLTECMMEGCRTKFKLKATKPHCLQCGWIMCDNCTGYAPIQSTFKKEKVCPECYETNLRKFWKDELLPDFMVDKSAQKSPSSMAGVRIRIDDKSYDWKELFIQPPNGIRPKVTLPNLNEEIASGTILIKGKVGVQKERWARIQGQCGKILMSLYNAQLDVKPIDEFDITKHTFSSSESDVGISFELRFERDVISFRIAHSENAEKWRDELSNLLQPSPNAKLRSPSQTSTHSAQTAELPLVKLQSPQPVSTNSSEQLDEYDSDLSDF
uniref:PH domain-containing protein n=1 Tax=Parascaris univalens TaxID=6257 RepID=A0A915BQJ8_PARUN